MQVIRCRRRTPVGMTDQNQRPLLTQQVRRTRWKLVQRDILGFLDVTEWANKFLRSADINHQRW